MNVCNHLVAICGCLQPPCGNLWMFAITLWQSVWNSVRFDISLFSWWTISWDRWFWYHRLVILSCSSTTKQDITWTCLLSRSSILTRTSERRAANFFRASARHRSTSLRWSGFVREHGINYFQGLSSFSKSHFSLLTCIRSYRSPPCTAALASPGNCSLRRPALSPVRSSGNDV